MKYIKKYKIFESDSDDILEKGHKISWSDIKDRLLYLNDLGFELEEESRNQYFVDEDFRTCPLSRAHKLVTEIKVVKELPGDADVVSRGQTFFQKWNDGQLEVLEAIASFCAHFDSCYYNYEHEFDKINISFIIYHDVDTEVRDEEKEKETNSKIREDILRNFEKAKNYIADSFKPTTKNKIFKNKIGETMNFLQGSYDEGFIVVPINLTGAQPQQIKRSLMPKLEDGVDRFERASGRIGKVELREITEEDIDKLAELRKSSFSDMKTAKGYFSERYLGLLGYIITFNYQKLFDKRKSEI